MMFGKKKKGQMTVVKEATESLNPQEKQLLESALKDLTDAWERTFIPRALFNRDKVKIDLVSARTKLNELEKVL